MPTIYAAMRNALFVVRPDGTTEQRLDGHDLECVAVDPRRPDRVFVGTFQNGLQRSTDGGRTFDRIGRDGSGPSEEPSAIDSPEEPSAIDPDAVMSIAFDPDDPETVWVGTEPSRVYRSVDGGATWRELCGLTDLDSADEWYFPPRPHTHHVRWIEPDPGDPEHLYVGIEAGALVQTHDRGATWEDRVPTARIDNHSLATHPAAPDRAWSAAGDGYAETHDGGKTWTYPQDGLEHRYCWSVAVDADDPDTVLVSAATGARTAHTPDRADAYVYRKRGDDPWKRLDDRGLPMGEGVVRAVLQRGTTGGEFYTVTNRGLYRSTNGGDRWVPLDVDWPEPFGSQTPRGLAVVP